MGAESLSTGFSNYVERRCEGTPPASGFGGFTGECIMAGQEGESVDRFILYFATSEDREILKYYRGEWCNNLKEVSRGSGKTEGRL